VNYVPELSHFAIETPGKRQIVAMLMAIRAATGGAGNRRPLFSAMDSLLSGAEQPERESSVVDLPSAVGGEAVRLTRLQMRNWKAFERADLLLPDGGERRPIVVVGGANGFGKSSILEAFALGLFGRRAISDVGFLMHATGGRFGQRRGYRKLLERTLHRSSKARREGMCSVSMDFDTADGPVSLERKWYFDEKGELVEDEEELLVRVGNDRHLLVTPGGVLARDWYQEEIERRIMPASLAPFFVFDGEQVERWAERRLSDQVRSAVARMLGLDDLRGLADDLRAYARDRERDFVADGTVDLTVTQAELDQLEAEIDGNAARLAGIDAVLTDRRAERDAVLARIASLSAGSHADLQAFLETEHRLTSERQRVERVFADMIGEHGPLLLVGQRLAARTAEAIEAELGADVAELEPDVVDALWARFISVDPPLAEDQIAVLRRRFVKALQPMEGVQYKDAHQHLDRHARRVVATRLRDAFTNGRAHVAEASESLRRVVQGLAEAKQAALEQERRSTERADAQRDLARLSAAIEAAEGERGSLRGVIEALSLKVEPLRTEMVRRAFLLREAEPRMHGAGVARSLAASLDAQMAAIADIEYSRFGEAVTRSFRALAHKNQVSRISIGPDGTVAVYDQAGSDVTDYRLSAGESQLFAMALIAAVGSIVGDRLPLVVDTPLSRLDTRHRESVLAMLGGRRSQTILLTQPEEVAAHHLQQLEPVLAGAVHLVHSVDPGTGVGVSRFSPGYDPVLTPKSIR
jgi:DNA sulfur modification protein DndD